MRDAVIFTHFTAPDAEILVVDDNETSLKAVLGQLGSLLMRIDTACNGEEALRMIRQKQYHLIFMDHMMPVVDGIEAVSLLRQTEGEYYQKVPVIAFSANDDAKESLLKAGMSDFLYKPVDLEEILEKVVCWLPEELLHKQTEGPLGCRAKERQEDLPVIEGIDSRKAVSYLGTKELFISLLRDFYRLIDLKAAKMAQYLADGLLRGLAVEAHALRSTSRMIGAGELSEGFARLEKYGNEENMVALEREMPEVLKLYRSFKPILKPIVDAAQSEKREAPAGELILLLKGLISAMDRFDLDGADKRFKQLEELQIPPECLTQMEMLRVYMADLAMEEVIKSAEAMLEAVEKNK